MLLHVYCCQSSEIQYITSLPRNFSQPSYLHNLITVQPPRSTRCSSSLVILARPSTSSIIFSTNSRSFLPVCFPLSLESTPTNLYNSDSPIVPRVAVLPSVPSTHHSHHPSLPHSFIPGLKPFFLQILRIVAFFFCRTNSTESPDCLPLLLSIAVFLLFSFLFLLYSFWFRAEYYGDLYQLLSARYNSISYHIVS